MKIDRISYQKLFPLGVYINERIGMEATLDPEDIAEDKLSELKNMVEFTHKSLNPQLYKNGNEPLISGFIPDEQVEKDSKERRIEMFIKEIERCATLDGNNGLLTYRLLANNTPELKEVYDKKFLELSKKQ
jgi:hypothetical protein